jgi:AraC-like DNA-binding protein
VDPLSDVLSAIRLNGAFFYLVNAVAPWSVSAPAARDLAPRILPESEHLISYHVVTGGSCWGGPIGEPQVCLRAGDVIVFPHGDPHVMTSQRDRRVEPDLVDAAPGNYPDTMWLGSSGVPDATFVCGFLGCDIRPFNPLIASLPRCLHVEGGAGGWLAEFPRQTIAESRIGRAGAATILTRMAELMFIEVIRRHLERLAPASAGWLAGLRDPVVGPALTSLHASPARDWSLAALARDAAVSRTVLAERFTRVVGVPPMQYLAQWRMQLAADRLARTPAKVAAVAGDVGYESEAAFSRAFRRAPGHTPSAFRRARATAATPAGLYRDRKAGGRHRDHPQPVDGRSCGGP